MLNIKSRQTYLKSQGLYNGEITGKEDSATKAAYKALQAKYGLKQGEYNEDTDKVLLNLARVKKRCKNFTLEEFKCGCGGKFCSGYPAYLDTNVLDAVQAIRSKYGATTITCGMRCQKYNDSLKGSIKNSKHIQGKALDIYVKGKSDTEAGRKEIMAYFKTLTGASYTYCNIGGNYPNMGSATHIDVK